MTSFTGTLYGSDGSSITITAAVQHATPAPPAPAPDLPPAPPPAGDRRHRSVWHHGWRGPGIDTYPVDIRAGLTDITLAMCQSAKSGTGRLTDPPGVTRAQVNAYTAAGVNVHLGIGGSGDGGITITNATQTAEVVASVLALHTSYGITGIRWDLEGTPGDRFAIDAIVSASRQVIAAGLRVGMWSSLYGGRLTTWGAVARALGAELDVWERGFYDFPEAGDARLTALVVNDLKAMRAYVQRDDQLVASFAPVGATSRTPVKLAVDAYTAARKAYPAAGFSVWADNDEHPGWAMTRALAAL